MFVYEISVCEFESCCGQLRKQLITNNIEMCNKTISKSKWKEEACLCQEF